MGIQRSLPQFQRLFDASSLIHIENSKKAMRALRRRKDEVRIPQKVAEEVRKPSTPLAKFIAAFPGVVTRFMNDQESEDYLRVIRQPGIHHGEAAAIAMAINRHLALVVDDPRAREKARSRGVTTLSWSEFLKSQ